MTEELYIRLRELVVSMSDEELDKLFDYLLTLKEQDNQ